MSAINQNVAKRAKRILEIAQDMASKMEGWQVSNRISEMHLHFQGYAESGYDAGSSGIVATSNWNDITQYVDGKHKLISNLPSRIANLFEKMGIELEWDDEWRNCCQCNKLVRTQGDSYFWKPCYILTEDGELCHECVLEDPKSHLEFLEGNCDTCNTIDEIDPEDHGYFKFNEDSYETGWHPGQTDHPEQIAKSLEEAGVTRYLFNLDENSQFYSKWSCYIHESERETLDNYERKGER